MELENPDLFEEAISYVASETCDKHVECIEKGGNRYKTEKEMKDKYRKTQVDSNPN